MKVLIGISGNLSKEQLRSLMQDIKTWREKQSDKMLMAITVDVPEITPEEGNKLLGDIYPFVLTTAPIVRPPGERLLSFLQSKGKVVPVSKREVYRSLHLSTAELERAAEPLERFGHIKSSSRVTTRGRRVPCYEVL